MIRKLAVLSLALCFGGAAEAYGTFRCQGRIIDPGATMAEVLTLCGPPSTQISQQVPIRAGTLTGFSRFIGLTAIDQLVYDRGWGKFPVVLHFHDGRVQRIDYLPFRSRGE